MNMGNNAVNAWWSILFYSADLAPRFTRGMWAMIACSIALVLWTTAILAQIAREKKAMSRTQAAEAPTGTAAETEKSN
jgi:ACS family pantothenate transporter-like MFS transporter